MVDLLEFGRGGSQGREDGASWEFCAELRLDRWTTIPRGDGEGSRLYLDFASSRFASLSFGLNQHFMESPMYCPNDSPMRP